MNKFPTPPPDRRIFKNKSNDEEYKSRQSDEFNTHKSIPLPFTIPQANMDGFIKTKSSSNLTNIKNSNAYIYSENTDNEIDKYNNLNLVKIKHIEDMRNNILSYKLLNDKKMFLSTNISNINVNKCNLILFGPSGSGKSSFIKTLYRALYGTPFLPPEAMNKLIIKDTFENEGTLCFTRLHLKEENSQSSGIIVCDTRGHIRMNESEREQFKVIIEGKVKEDVQIMQKPERSLFQLFEFWKKDSELFPKEIFNAQEPGLDSIPHIIVLVFDGSTDEVIDAEDENFYKDLIEISYRKGN